MFMCSSCIINMHFQQVITSFYYLIYLDLNSSQQKSWNFSSIHSNSKSKQELIWWRWRWRDRAKSVRMCCSSKHENTGVHFQKVEILLLFCELFPTLKTSSTVDISSIAFKSYLLFSFDLSFIKFPQAKITQDILWEKITQYWKKNTIQCNN